MSYRNNILGRIVDKALKVLSLCVVLGVTGCSEDIDESNRYTFTGETVVDYLENRSDIYSSFIYILDKATVGKGGNVRHLLSTYGTYTCFAPTNEAIERFLIEQDSIYWDQVEKLANGEITE